MEDETNLELVNRLRDYLADTILAEPAGQAQEAPKEK
jgi:hypothetical protein